MAMRITLITNAGETHIEVEPEDLILEKVAVALGTSRIDVLFGAEFITDEDTFEDVGIDDGGRLMVSDSGLATLGQVVAEIVELNEQVTKEDILMQWGGEEPEFWTESRVVGDFSLARLGLFVLPPGFGDLTISGSLQLTGNRLVSLPETFGNLTIVGDLHLHKNRLESLPDTFGNITVGAEMNLSCNQLRELPANFREAADRCKRGVILKKNPGHTNRHPSFEGMDR